MINKLKAGDFVWYHIDHWREDDIGVLVTHEKRLLGLLIEKDTSALAFGKAWRVLPIGSQKIESVHFDRMVGKANVR
jgi:hypothetical protein